MSPNGALALGAVLLAITTVAAGLAPRVAAPAQRLSLSLGEVVIADGGYLATLQVTNRHNEPIDLAAPFGTSARTRPILSDANGGLCTSALFGGPAARLVEPGATIQLPLRYAVRDCHEPLAPGAGVSLTGTLVVRGAGRVSELPFRVRGASVLR